MALSDLLAIGTKCYLVNPHGCEPGVIHNRLGGWKFGGEWGTHYYAGFVRKIMEHSALGWVYVTLSPVTLVCSWQPGHRGSMGETVLVFRDVSWFKEGIRTVETYSSEVLRAFPRDIAEAHLTLATTLNA